MDKKGENGVENAKNCLKCGKKRVKRAEIGLQ
jgi:ribosomal protein L37AE/L43A